MAAITSAWTPLSVVLGRRVPRDRAVVDPVCDQCAGPPVASQPMPVMARAMNSAAARKAALLGFGAPQGPSLRPGLSAGPVSL
jgi:hypothetical protein